MNYTCIESGVIRDGCADKYKSIGCRNIVHSIAIVAMVYSRFQYNESGDFFQINFVHKNYWVLFSFSTAIFGFFMRQVYQYVDGFLFE